MKERIQEAFHWLDENLTDSSEVFGFSEIVLVCCLEWVEKRQMFDWRSYTKVVAAHERFKDQPSLQKTRIPEAM
jgi:glutathione S-transferase